MNLYYLIVELLHYLFKIRIKDKVRYRKVTGGGPFPNVTRAYFKGDIFLMGDYRYGFKGAGGCSYSCSLLTRRFTLFSVTRGYNHQKYRWYLKFFIDGCPGVRSKKDYKILSVYDLVKYN